jgi:hypothetical protein
MAKAAAGEVSKENLAIAKMAAAAFGADFTVRAYYDVGRKNEVDILRCEDRPEKAFTSYATIGLSDHPNYRDGEEFETRLEIVGACRSSFDRFANVLATAAFCVIKSHWFCAPGIIFPDVVAAELKGSAMKHLMFVPPFLWEEELKTLRFPKKTVAWLLAVPVADAELRYAREHGPRKLEAVFEKRKVDVFDIDRKSAV